MLTLGMKIKKVRELKNFKQETVAEMLGMSQSNYSRIETDEAAPSPERLEQIAKVLGVSVQDIIAFDEKVFFNQMNNQTAVGYNNTVNQYGLSENERKLYEDKIKLLEEMVIILRQENENLKAKGQ
jgi:transcriptional regulator with XRE-family HTH domain